MSSVVEIVNSALTTLAVDPIADLTDPTLEARTASAKWEMCRKSSLRLYNWNFAIKRAELPRDLTAPINEYPYSYTLPADLLRLIKVVDDFDFKKEGNKIATKNETCSIRYLYDETDTELYDPLFSDMLAARMALEMAYTFPRTQEMIPAMTKLYAMKLMDAKTLNSSEDIPEDFGHFDNTLVAIRY